MKGLLLILLCYLSYSMQKCTEEDDHYVAAVVEFALKNNVTYNLNLYVKIIRKAAKKNADIVVFPERTLTGVYVSVPIPIYGLLKEYPVPAEYPELYDDILVKLSLAAKENGIYVVVNVKEVLDCTVPQEGEECQEKRKYYYSTNIVFDRNGALGVRYRKIKLFGEAFFSPYTSADNMATFDTDFGVTFANFIHLDILYQVPQMKSIANREVTDVIFPALWYTELPYFNSYQVARAIANGLNVTILAAGANAWEDRGAGGSGIFSSDGGALISVVKKVNSYRLLVAEVPKIPGNVKQMYPGPLEADPAELDSLITLTDTSIDSFLTRTLEPGYQEFTLEFQDVSCTFTVNITFGTGEQYYRYRAAAFSGVRKLAVDANTGVRTCTIIACTDDDIYSCAKRFPKYTEDSIAQFSELTITGTLPTPGTDPETNAPDSTFYVTSLKTTLTALQPNDVEYKSYIQETNTVCTVSLNNLDSQLYMFGFYGRKFGDDGNPVTIALAENIFTKMTMEDD